MPQKWSVSAADQGALIVGREDTVHLQSECAVCVEKVTVKDAQKKELKTKWKVTKPDEIEVQIPLKDETAGSIEVAVKQFGLQEAEGVSLPAYSEGAHLDRFMINTGDHEGVLVGTRLDEVKELKLNGTEFVPGKLVRAEQKDELPLLASNNPSPVALTPEEKLVAYVALKDGRVLDLQTTVAPPRPKVTLIGKTIQPGPTPSAIHFSNQEQLPQDGRISFFLKSEIPDKFPRTEKLEVATEDGLMEVSLSITDGGLVLQDAQTVLATLDPLKSFGASAFGPLQFRPVGADGAKGDWQPLTHLVRVPGLKEIRCPDTADKPCSLSGTNLFLIDSVASDAQFTRSVPVPLGFIANTLTVPRPNGTLLYVKLRDDPSTVDTAVLAVLPDSQ